MPLNTELLDKDGERVPISWGWYQDRMPIAQWVLLDGGTVGEADSWDKRGLLDMGYFGAGCDHTFTNEYHYRQIEWVDGKPIPGSDVHITPGMRYREYRS